MYEAVEPALGLPWSPRHGCFLGWFHTEVKAGRVAAAHRPQPRKRWRTTARVSAALASQRRKRSICRESGCSA